MSRFCIVVIACSTVAFGQTTAPPTDNLPVHPSFGLQDPNVLQRGPNKPVLGKAGPAPLLADGKPDLTGPWEPNAININVNMKAAGVEIPFSPEGETLYKSRLA